MAYMDYQDDDPYRSAYGGDSYQPPNLGTPPTLPNGQPASQGWVQDPDGTWRQVQPGEQPTDLGYHGPALPGATPPPPTPPPGSGGQTTAPTGTLGGLLAPFQGTFTPPTPTAYPTAPQFQAPGYTPPAAFVPDKFQAPTFEDAQNDPGYQFARDQGEQALTQGKAAGGLLNTGGTLKDILAWGQNYAAQRYGDVYNRNYNTWQGNEGAKERAYATNYGSQYLDPYKFAYQGALDAFNPTQSQWQTNMAATQRGNENDYANAYQRFQGDFNRWQDQRDSTFDKTFKYVTA